jgi:hypothetical protein
MAPGNVGKSEDEVVTSFPRNSGGPRNSGSKAVANGGLPVYIKRAISQSLTPVAEPSTTPPKPPPRAILGKALLVDPVPPG